MMKKEFEASLSLLHMLQHEEAVTGVKNEEVPRPRSPSEWPKSNPDTWETELNRSLLLAAAQQVDPENAAASAPGGFLRRNSQLNSLTHDLNLDELRAHFGKPIVEVAKEFGICTTFLKKICRRCGIKRWPHRQIRSLNRTIEMLRQAEANATSAQEKRKFANQLADVEAKKRAVILDPDSNGRVERVKKSLLQRSNVPPANPNSTTTQTLPERGENAALETTMGSDGLAYQYVPTSPDTLQAITMDVAESTVEVTGLSHVYVHKTSAAVASTDKSAAPAPVPPAVNVGFDPATELLQIAAETPKAAAHARRSSETEASASEGLRISPCHRKVVPTGKNDGMDGVHRSSMESLRGTNDVKDDDEVMMETVDSAVAVEV